MWSCPRMHVTEDKSTLFLVMAWCRQGASHYLSQCWPRSLPSLGPNELSCICTILTWLSQGSVPALVADWLTTVKNRCASHFWRHQHDLSDVWRHWLHYKSNDDCVSLAVIWPVYLFLCWDPLPIFRCWTLANRMQYCYIVDTVLDVIALDLN